MRSSVFVCGYALAVLAACSAGNTLDGSEQSAVVPKGGQQSSIAPGERKDALIAPATSEYIYTFRGTAGQAISIFAEGQQELDTVLYLHRASSRTGAPYGMPIASNDDTELSGWTPNPYSSSIEHFELPQTRTYAIVVAAYDPSASGRATVWFDNDLPGYDAPPPFAGQGTGRPLAWSDVRASALPLGGEISSYASQAGGTALLVLSRVQVAPADAQAIADDGARLGKFAFEVIYRANSSPPGVSAGDSGPAAAAALAPADAAAALAQSTGAQSDPRLAQAEQLLLASMLGDGHFASGTASVFKTHWDNGDDTSADGVLAIDAATGEARAVTFINPP